MPQAIAAAAIVTLSDGHYAQFVARWDGREFLSIVTDGYPEEPALTPDGQVADGRWAFYPLFPLLVRWLSWASGLSVEATASTVNVFAGCVAVILLYRLCRVRLSTPTSRAAVVVYSTATTAPVVQLVYSEAVALALLMTMVLLAARQRYRWVMVVIPVLALARPLAAPVAAAFAVEAVVRLLRSDRPRATWCAACAAAAAVSAVIWPVYAGLRTGRPFIYLDTENAYDHSGISRSWLVWAVEIGVAGVLIALVVFALLVWIDVRFMPPRTETWWRAWLVVYPSYILAGTYVSGATLRLLLPTFSAAVLTSSLLRRLGGWPVVAVAAFIGVATQMCWLAFFVGRDRGLVP